jgi:hypothetical protein
MKTIMSFSDFTTIEHLEHFLQGTQPCVYTILSSKDERYEWIQKTLIQFNYMTLRKRDKGVVIRYVMQMSGYSRQQVARLIKQYTKSGKIVRRQQTRKAFTRRYTDADIRQLAVLDELHQTPSGPVLKKLCERAHEVFGEAGFERLSTISSSHIYNLRASKTYQKERRYFKKTQARSSTIGERRRPQPNGRPGYLRIDTVHQGDQDKVKGAYHINIVDEVSQFEITCCVEKISEQFLIPSLISMLDILPFIIRGFHSDNGSEYVNKVVVELLKKLHIEFTKSRSRRSNDNALVEGKNGAVIRKQFGYTHIPQRWAELINDTIQMPLYIYLNFHRPCFFATTEIDHKGRERKKYPYKNIMTPYQKLVSLPDIEDHLKPDVSLAGLKQIANEMTDNESATQLKKAKEKIFSQVFSAQREHV